MPDQPRSGDRNAAQRAADHAGIARLAEALVPALVMRLATANLGEVEIREGDWHIRVRRPAGAAPRRERPHRASLPIVAQPGAPFPALPAAPDEGVDDGRRQEAALSPTVGMFKPGIGPGTRVRAGDRIATVDLLGIALDVVSPIDGIVVEVYPQAGDGVEFGEEIALVEAEPKPDSEPASADGAGEG